MRSLIDCAILIANFRQEYDMSVSTLEAIRSAAMGLSEQERAELARALVASLDGPADADADKAWDAEILKRLAEIDSGAVQPISRTEFRRRLQDRIANG